MAPKGDLSKINDPNFVLEIAAGPPFPKLVAQEPGSGIQMGRKHEKEPKRFIFKAAHMSNDDYRIFDAQGRLVCNAWHKGKNPYGGLDPLGLGHAGPQQEWESLCQAHGYHGMPGFKVKPKLASTHGRQFVQSPDNQTVYFSVANESRIKTGSIRHNLEVCEGANGPQVYSVLVDLTGRTMQVQNKAGQQVAFIQKSVKALIQTAALGSGSECVIDIAPGVDWTFVLALMIGIKQIGEHLVKDVASNFVAPKVQDAALEATGLSGVANAIGQRTDKVQHVLRQGHNIMQFYKSA